MNRALIPRGLRRTHAPAGATRNYEIWNDRRGEEDEGDEADDAMKALEARTENSKLEMDILDALDDTKAINKRKLNVDTSSIIGKMRDSQEARAKESIELDDAEEDLIEQTEFAGSSRRIGEEEEERRKKQREEVMAASRAAAAAAAAGGAAASGAASGPKRLAGLVVKRKEPASGADADATEVPSKAAKVAVAEQAAPVSLGAMLGGYSDSGSASD